MNNTELSTLRDQLLEKRAIQQQKRAQSDKAIENLKGLIAELLTNHQSDLCNIGVEIDKFSDIDYDRLKDDEEYLQIIKRLIADTIEKLRISLEEILSV
jgi:hypothetical protein